MPSCDDFYHDHLRYLRETQASTTLVVAVDVGCEISHLFLLLRLDVHPRYAPFQEGFQQIRRPQEQVHGPRQVPVDADLKARHAQDRTTNNSSSVTRVYASRMEVA